MKKKEIAAMSVEELKARLVELRKELMKLNTQVAAGTPPKNSGQVRAVKKNIARILTFIKDKKPAKGGSI
jgi:large subunit ribosomal protein L29